MKKLVSVVAAVVLTLALGVTAFAASPVAITSDDVTVKAANEVETAKLTANVKENAKAYLGDSYTENATVVAVVNFEPGSKKAGEQATVKVAGIKKGDTVVLLHYIDGKDVPELIKTTTEDGAITFTVPETFSPFVIVKTADAPAAAAAPAATSPKTGEAVPAAVAVMLLAGAGIVMLNRKKVA